MTGVNEWEMNGNNCFEYGRSLLIMLKMKGTFLGPNLTLRSFH